MRQPDIIVDVLCGKIAVEIRSRVAFDGIDALESYEPALASELVPLSPLEGQIEHCLSGSFEEIPRWEEMGLLGPGAGDRTTPPWRYTAFCWTSDGGAEYRRAGIWPDGYGGYYSVEIGAMGEPAEQDRKYWPTTFREAAVIATMPEPFPDREPTDFELRELKSDLAAAAMLGFRQLYR